MTRSSLAAARAALPRALPALAAVLTLAGCAGPGTPSDGGTLADRAQRLRERVEARQARDVVADAQAEHKRTGRPQAVVCMESRAGDRLLLAGDVVAVRSGVPIVKPRGKPTMLARRKGFGPAQGGSGGTSSATYTVTDALVIGAATTSGVRLDIDAGYLCVREGDDSAGAPMIAYTMEVSTTTTAQRKAFMTAFPGVEGLGLASDALVRWSSSSPIPGSPGFDTGITRDSAAQVVVTDGSTGIGNLRATALIVGTADTSGVRLDLESGNLAVREGDDSGYVGVNCNNLTASDYIVGARFQKSGLWELNGTTGTLYIKESGNNSATNIHQITASSGALSGASYSFTNALPAGAIILGVTVRVTTTVTGATSFDVGDGTDVDRYGAAVALASGTTTTFASATANPLEWRSANGNVVLTANGSNFTGGVVRICVHYLTGTAPTS